MSLLFKTVQKSHKDGEPQGKIIGYPKDYKTLYPSAVVVEWRPNGDIEAISSTDLFFPQ